MYLQIQTDYKAKGEWYYMALIKCPECGKGISNKAKKCPNCGYTLKKNK